MLHGVHRASASTTDGEWRTIMIKSRFGTVLSTCYCTCVVFALILLQGCSRAAKIESTVHLPRLTSETFVEETKHVLNPDTGELEKLTVFKTHTIVTESPSETIEEVWEYVPNPDTGELEKFLVQRTHTTVTQTSSEKILESEAEDTHAGERTDYDYLILSGLSLTIILINLL